MTGNSTAAPTQETARLDTMAARLVTSWTNFYTRGLPEQTKRRRRLEVQGDVWEQALEAQERGANRWQLSSDCLQRLILGFHADLSWRIGQVGKNEGGRVAERSSSVLTMTRKSPLTGLAMAAFVVAALWWILLAVYSAAGEHISSTAEDVAFVLAVIAAAAMIGAGVVYGLRGAMTSAGLLVGGGLLLIVIAFVWGPTTW